MPVVAKRRSRLKGGDPRSGALREESHCAVRINFTETRMDFRLTSEQEAFRREFASWLENNTPEDFDPQRFRNYDTHEDLAQAHRDFQKRLSEAGYAGMNLPVAYGGQGRSTMEEMIVTETISRTCPELRAPGVITFGMATPTILVCGNEAQKAEFLPRILNP